MQNIIKIAGLIHRQKKILLIKEWSKKRNGYFWNVVKGTFETKNDLNLHDALKREVKEEINLEIAIDGLLSIFEKRKENDFVLQFNFLCHPKKNSLPSLPKKFKKDEMIIEYKWFTQKGFDSLSKKDIMDKRVNSIVKCFYSKKPIFLLP